MKNSRGLLFVTGTDTGVGKTWVTALLALKLRQMGHDCGVFKPFASGCEMVSGALVSEDAVFLRDALGLSDSLDEICSLRLGEPLAPLIAARRAGISTRKWLETATAALENLRSKHEWIIIEGVGGLLAPIWETESDFRSNLDLINEWQAPTVLVARRTLGTINHTLLTLRAPLMGAAHFAGLVFNDCEPIENFDVAAQTSPEFIGQISAVPMWGTVPYLPDTKNLEAMATKLDIRLPK